MSIAPGAFVLVVEILVWIAAAITGWQASVEVGATALAIGVLAGVVAPIAIVLTRRRDALMWAIVSVCVSFLGLFFGVLLLFVASAACRHDCFS